jgi:hypothetical protein
LYCEKCYEQIQELRKKDKYFAMLNIGRFITSKLNQPTNEHILLRKSQASARHIQLLNSLKKLINNSGAKHKEKS